MPNSLNSYQTYIMPLSKLFLFVGSLNALIAVILGAFGAHYLRSRIPPEMIEVYQTGIHYHLFHALGLLILSLIAFHIPTSGYIKLSGWLMLAGIILFSGSLYALSISGINKLGVITPFGGISFIVAWFLLAFGTLKA